MHSESYAGKSSYSAGHKVSTPFRDSVSSFDVRKRQPQGKWWLGLVCCVRYLVAKHLLT